MMRKIERDNTGLLKVGQDLVIAGFAGLTGSRIIAEERHEELCRWFSEEYLEMAASRQCVREGLGMDFWKNFGAVECEPAGEGGILTAIWNLSAAYGMGVEFVLRLIPVAQETIEICERFELNPYRLYSAGCYLLAAENGGQLVQALASEGIPAQVIGKVNPGIAREMIGAESRGYLERPQRDELFKAVSYINKNEQGGNQR
ncbi:MAG: AIR synthase-related protein [Brotaphodocola sp.]